jgi:hypothetical protein
MTLCGSIPPVLHSLWFVATISDRVPGACKLSCSTLWVKYSRSRTLLSITNLHIHHLLKLPISSYTMAATQPVRSASLYYPTGSGTVILVHHCLFWYPLLETLWPDHVRMSLIGGWYSASPARRHLRGIACVPTHVVYASRRSPPCRW